MIDGNTAAALGCVFAGATVGAWYPITPSTSLMDAYKAFADRMRVDPETGKKNFAFIQAEDELAAIGMVLGASWNGARAFTATSGPGVSLMNEFLGLAYYAEVPAVLFDIQRVGPSTGMPTRTQQCDILEAAYASHGDTKHVCLFPRDPEECFYFARDAFDLAERLQTPVLVMSRSRHRHERLDVSRSQVGRQLRSRSRQGAGRRTKSRSSRSSIAISTSTATAFRTARCRACIPRARISRAARATRSTARTPRTRAEYQIVLDRLTRKFHTAKRLVPKAVIEQDPKIDIARRRLRQLRRRGARGARRPAEPRAQGELHAPALVPVRRGRREIPRGAQARVRDRAEPRRADALAAHARDARGEGEAALAAALQRTADLLGVHRRRACSPKSNPRRASPKWCPRRPRRPPEVSHDLPAETESPSSFAAEERARAHAPRLRGRFVDAVRGMRPRLASPPPLSKPPGVSTSSRRTW